MTRLRLRRRLLAWSAPAVVVALVVAYKLISVVIVGNMAAADLADRDANALRDDVGRLAFLDIAEPDKTAFWAANLAAAEGRLAEADSRFSELLAHSDLCSVRVNLELVRETDGDRVARAGDAAGAERRYREALAVVEQASLGCFEGNTDPDAERRTVRADAAARLAAKIDALHKAAQPAPPAPAPTSAPPPPPPPPPVDASAMLGTVNPDWLPGEGPPPELRLEPGVGNPLDRLQEALANSDAVVQR